MGDVYNIRESLWFVVSAVDGGKVLKSSKREESNGLLNVTCRGKRKLNKIKDIK